MPSCARAVRRERRREVVEVALRRVRSDSPSDVVCDARVDRSDGGHDRPSDMVRSRSARTEVRSADSVEIRSDKSDSCEEEDEVS